MKPQNFYNKAISHYPSLFYAGGSHSVLSHALLTIGNGVEWRNGELETEYGERKPILIDVCCLALRQDSLELYYPICEEYANLCNIPENVTQEWLGEIEDFCYNIYSMSVEVYRGGLDYYFQIHYGKFNKETSDFDQYIKNLIDWKQYIENVLIPKYNWKWDTE